MRTPSRTSPRSCSAGSGPATRITRAFGTLWRGATLALEEENAAGGISRCCRIARRRASSGKPFRLEPVWSESPWQAGIAALLRLVYDQQAWAVIGGVDGTTTHLALQVALKSHFLLLTPGSTDVSTDRANVPWLFSLAPSDESLASVVVPALAKGMPDRSPSRPPRITMGTPRSRRSVASWGASA